MSTGYIPQEILDEIIDRCDIVSVINEYVPLKRRGSNYQGLCPFHNEKTPSFSVSPGKKIFHCFGCGKGGNIFRFLMEMEGISFVEAAEKLAKRAGISLPEKELSQAQKIQMARRKRYLQINNYVARYYHKVLVETKQGQPYAAYLQERQIFPETVEMFQLGATPDGWDTLYQILKRHGVSEQEMLDLGLISESRKPGRYIDRFRQRLIYPIQNERGDVIAFGGRVIDKVSSSQKYLNSPDTPLFHKSRNLYGLHLAKNEIRNADLAILVEGYMDVISCHQYGIKNAVAPLGTAFTLEQGKLLMRSTYQVGISLDGDSAGMKATMRCLNILSDLGCNARVIQIPDGADPDEYLKLHGKKGFETLISKSQEMIMYKITRYMETTNTDSILGKMQVVEKLLPDVKKMQSAVARETAVRQMSQQLQVSEKAIWDELQRKKQSSVGKENSYRETGVSSEITGSLTGILENKVERNILRILYEQPTLLKLVEAYGGAELFHENGRQLYQIFVEQIQRNGKVDSGLIPQEMSQILADLLVEEIYMNDFEKSFQDSLWQLKQEYLDSEYQQLMQKLQQLTKMQQTELQQMGAKKEMQEVLQKLDSIRKEKRKYEASRREN